MTTQDDIVTRSRANHHDLGTTHQDRTESNIRNHVFAILKEADDAAAGTATAERAVFRVPAHMANGIEVLSIYYTPDAAITADDTNNAVITFSKRDGAGGSATVVATATTNLAFTSLVAHTPRAITLSSTIANRQLAAGEVLTELISKGGTGVAVQAGSFTVVYKEL